MLHLCFSSFIACFATNVDGRISCTAWGNGGTSVNDMTNLPWTLGRGILLLNSYEYEHSLLPRKLQHTPRAHPRQSPHHYSLLVKVAFRGVKPSSVCCFTTLDFLLGVNWKSEKVKLSLILFMIVTALTAFDVTNLQPFLPEVGNDQFFFFRREENRELFNGCFWFP